MIIECVSTMLTEEQRKLILPAFPIMNYSSRIAIGEQYHVLGLNFLIDDNSFPNGVSVEIAGDNNEYETKPLCLFKIIDPRPSKYWIADTSNHKEMTMWPKEFYKRAFHDRLSNCDPECEEDYYRVIREITAEYADDPWKGSAILEQE